LISVPNNIIIDKTILYHRPIITISLAQVLMKNKPIPPTRKQKVKIAKKSRIGQKAQRMRKIIATANPNRPRSVKYPLIILIQINRLSAIKIAREDLIYQIRIFSTLYLVLGTLFLRAGVSEHLNDSFSAAVFSEFQGGFFPGVPESRISFFIEKRFNGIRFPFFCRIH
jgi:hypothetical protein